MASGEELITAAAMIVGNRYPIDSAEWDFEVEQVAMRLAFRGRSFQRFVDDLAKNAEKVSPVKRWARITAVTKAKAKDGRPLNKATVHYEVPKKDGPADTYHLDTAFFSEPGARQLARRCQELRGRMVYLYQWYEENTDRKTVDTGNGSVTPSAFSILVGVEAIPDENGTSAQPSAPVQVDVAPEIRATAVDALRGAATILATASQPEPGPPPADPPPPPLQPDVPATPPAEVRYQPSPDDRPDVDPAALNAFKAEFAKLGPRQGELRAWAKAQQPPIRLTQPANNAQLAALTRKVDELLGSGERPNLSLVGSE